MNNRTIYRRLGKTIVKLRKQNNLSQEQLALDCYIDHSYLSEIKAGKANPSLKMLNKIARVLDCEIWQLVKEV
jgi:transcriptional regulator with XRE-family HTH domain